LKATAELSDSVAFVSFSFSISRAFRREQGKFNRRTMALFS